MCSIEPKQSPRIVAGLVWKPFDLRFGATLEKIAHHQKILEFNLNWIKMDESTKLINGLAGDFAAKAKAMSAQQKSLYKEYKSMISFQSSWKHSS
jgi:hypothetical protein